jgi:CBS domain containing-hemolysin-like protein
MFPRKSAIFIEDGTSIQEAVQIFIKHGISRAPVYRDDPDTVIGMVDSRDIMPCHLGYRKAKNINRFIKEIEFYPASRELKDLLNDFLSAGIQIAIVVDEYGGTAGVVTLNKILSELLGKKFTKWEEDYKPEYKRVGERISVISGEMQIEDFNYLFDESLEARESDSIGGYIIEKLATFPRRGEEIETERHTLRVKYIKRNKVETIEVIQKGGEE